MLLARRAWPQGLLHDAKYSMKAYTRLKPDLKPVICTLQDNMMLNQCQQHHCQKCTAAHSQLQALICHCIQITNQISLTTAHM